jgi:predicted protein tyrosine phosphatase
MVPRNKMMVVKNNFQGNALRVLCVCSGGVLRSPTAAEVLNRPPFDFNTRSCGSADYALVPLTEELALWADEVVVFDTGHMQAFMDVFHEATKHEEATCPMVHVMNIEDDYNFRDPELVRMLTEKFKELFV